MLPKSLVAALAAGSCFIASPALAARVVSTIDADLSAGAYMFTNNGADFTFGFNGDYFGGGPVTISTANGGEVNTVFGQPTTNFADGRGGPLSFGPNDQYAAFSAATPIRFTNGDNFIGLRAVTAAGTFYGYAFTTNNTLNTIGFETRADTAITATQGVPEPASWAMLVGGFGIAGAAMRRRSRPATAVA